MIYLNPVLRLYNGRIEQWERKTITYQKLEENFERELQGPYGWVDVTEEEWAQKILKKRQGER